MQKVLFALALIAACANGQFLLNNLFLLTSPYYSIDIDLKADLGY